MKPYVYQRKSDSKWVGICERKHEKGEKRKRTTVYGNTEKEAWEKINQIAYEIQTDQYIPPAKDTLIGFLYEYYNVCLPKWETTTAELYKMYIDVHFKPYFNDMKLKDIKAITLDAFYNHKLTTEREHSVKQGKKTVTKKLPPLSNNTVIKLNKFLKAAFRYAIINDKIRKNPTDGVKLSPIEKYKPTIYSEDQFLKLLDYVHGKDEEIPIILGAGCGFRRGEILGLKWRNIDFKNNTIEIETTEVNFTNNLTKDPKTSTSKRKISAPGYVIDILDVYYKRNGEPDKEQKVVTKWKPKSLSDRFNKLLDKYNLEHIRLHDLRHYNAVLMLKSNIADKVAAERLGHANVSTLREVYQHVLRDMDEAAADKINKSIKPKEKQPDRILTKEELKASFKVV